MGVGDSERNVGGVGAAEVCRNLCVRKGGKLSAPEVWRHMCVRKGGRWGSTSCLEVYVCDEGSTRSMEAYVWGKEGGEPGPAVWRHNLSGWGKEGGEASPAVWRHNLSMWGICVWRGANHHTLYWFSVKVIGRLKITIFHYCVYFKFVTVKLFVKISQNFTKIERVVFELCAKVCE